MTSRRRNSLKKFILPLIALAMMTATSYYAGSHPPPGATSVVVAH